MNWTPDKIEILKGYLADGESLRSIGQKFGCSYDAIEKTLRRYDLVVLRPVPIKSEKVIKTVDMEALKDVDFDKQKEEAKLKWIPAKSKIAANKKKAYETMIVVSDHHIPHQDDASNNAVLKFMDDVKPDKFAILGDFLDYGCVSHWNQGRNKTLELQRLKGDYIKGNVLLDEYEVRLPKNCEKHFFEGNHEEWIKDLIEKIPQLEGLVEPTSQLKLIERGYKIYPYNDIIKFGKLNLTHGIYACENCTKKHLDMLKVNVMFGHTHTMEIKMSSSPAREVAFSGYNVGCLCNMAPDYMRGRPHGWTHGFAVVYLYPNGYFEVNMIRILNGKFIYNGKIYQG